MPVVASRQSTRVVYASRAGVPLDADFANPTAGTDASARLQAILDTATAGPLHLVIDGVCKAHDLKLHSGTTVSGLGGSYEGSGAWPKSGVILSPNGSPSSVQSLFRNNTWRSPVTSLTGPTLYGSSSDTVCDFGNVADRDIKVRDLFVFGNSGTSTGQASAGGTDRRFNNAGFWINTFAFFGVQNLRLENLWVYDPPTYGYFVAYGEHIRCRNLAIVDPFIYGGGTGYGRNSDGLHLVGPIRDCSLDGLYGWAGDDFFAINATDGNMVAGAGGSDGTGSALWGSYLNVYKGPIVDVHARNVVLPEGLSFGRILSDTTLVDRIVLEGYSGHSSEFVFTATEFSTVTGGNIGRVSFRNWQVDTDGAGGYGIRFGLGTKALGIDGLQMNSGSMQGFAAVESAANTVGLIAINDSYINNYRYVLLQSGGNLSGAMVSNSRHPAKDGANASVAVSGTLPVLAGAGNWGVTTSGTITDASKFGSA